METLGTVAEDREDIAASVREPARFGHLFDRHVSAIHSYLSRRTSPEDADDLASATFVTAFRVRRTFDPALGSARAWLFGIARNEVLHYRRAGARSALARQRMPCVIEPEPSTDALERRLDAQRRVENALSLIGDELREVVLLIGVGELTYAECAGVLDIPIGTVRSRYARARRVLRDLIEENETDRTALSHTSHERTV